MLLYIIYILVKFNTVTATNINYRTLTMQSIIRLDNKSINSVTFVYIVFCTVNKSCFLTKRSNERSKFTEFYSRGIAHCSDGISAN